MKSTRSNHSKTSHQPTGSPEQGESVFIMVGKIRRPHGVEGEMVTDMYSDFPERFQPGKTILVGEDHLPYQVRSSRSTSTGLLISVDGIDTPEQAGELRNRLVYVASDALPALPEGAYYHYQIIGLQVFDENGKIMGILNEVITTGANDVYVVVDEDGKESLFPALESVILSIDIEQKRMVVRPQEWL
jgi:16S rRNA processing protein RimM